MLLYGLCQNMHVFVGVYVNCSVESYSVGPYGL